MKKIISILLTFLLVCLLPASSYVVGSTNSTLITYTAEGLTPADFTITVPSTVTIGSEDDSISVGVNAGSVVESGKKLQFAITESSNYDSVNNKFRLLSTSDSSVYLGYKITKSSDAAETDIAKDEAFMEATVAEAYAGKSISLKYLLTEEPSAAGTYTDTITITVTAVDAV